MAKHWRYTESNLELMTGRRRPKQNRRQKVDRRLSFYTRTQKMLELEAAVMEKLEESLAHPEPMTDFEFLFDASDLVENPSTRLPICLVLDVSGSMSGEAIEELNKGVHTFFEALREDEVALYAADICIITFNSQVEMIQEFSSIAGPSAAPTLESGGPTYMGEAVNVAIDALEKRKLEYQENGVDYFQPWLVLMTDGVPNGNLAEFDKAVERTAQLVKTRKLTIFPIGIGPYADLKALQQLSYDRQPLRLQGFKFKEFFSWLSQSVATTSQSMPGDKVALNVEGLKGWAELSL